MEDSHYGQKPGISFSRRLTQLNDQSYQMQLDALHERIYVQGQRVAQKADLMEFQNYRVMIARFIYEAVSNAYAFHKDDRADKHGRRKACYLIKNINAKLDEMAKEVLKEQADNLNIMSMAEEIRGMLIDLYL